MSNRATSDPVANGLTAGSAPGSPSRSLPLPSFVRRAAGWAGAWLKFFYPEVCQLCDSQRATPADGFVCASCRQQVRPVQEPMCAKCGRPVQGAITNEFVCGDCSNARLSYSTARAAALSNDLLLEVIHRFKYNRALWFEPFLAGLLCVKAAPELGVENWDWIVPVPLYPAKERDRGFNQAELLAAHLAKATGIPLNTRLLRRILPTRTQTQLTREERLENVRRAFGLRRRASVTGQKIVIVDDVFTTGATTDACARVLIRASAAKVCVWTVARGV